jgi:predicted nucleic acid-binding protein
MSVEAFLDTNVLVYAVSSDPGEAFKKKRALALIESIDFGLSAQVMQEFYVVVTRKIARPLASDDALALLEQYRRLPVAWTDYPLLVASIEASLKFGISYWDGAIIAAAERLGATTLFSEDLSHGQRYGSITVVNPFLREDSTGVHDSGAPEYG